MKIHLNQSPERHRMRVSTWQLEAGAPVASKANNNIFRSCQWCTFSLPLFYLSSGFYFGRWRLVDRCMHTAAPAVVRSASDEFMFYVALWFSRKINGNASKMTVASHRYTMWQTCITVAGSVRERDSSSRLAPAKLRTPLPDEIMTWTTWIHEPFSSTIKAQKID